MDFSDAVLNIGLPVAGAFLIPGPIGAMAGGALGGALGSYWSAKWDGKSDAYAARDAVVGGFLGGVGGKYAALASKALGIGARQAGVRTVNRLGQVLDELKPRALQTLGAGVGGWAANAGLDGFDNTVARIVTSKDCPGIPIVRKPTVDLAPEVDSLFRQLPQFFCRASYVIGNPGGSSPPKVTPLKAEEGRSGIPKYDTRRESINTNSADIGAKEEELVALVGHTAKTAKKSQLALEEVIRNLNDAADSPPSAKDVNAFYLAAIDKAVKETEDVIDTTLAAAQRAASQIPTPTPTR